MWGRHCMHADSNRYTKHSHCSPTRGRHTAIYCSNTCYGHPHAWRAQSGAISQPVQSCCTIWPVQCCLQVSLHS